MTIVVAVLASVIANLITPSVRSGAIKLFYSAAIKMRSSSIKMAKVRLGQLEEERALIDDLAKRPLKLANSIATQAVLQVGAYLLIVVMIMVAAFANDGTLELNNIWAAGFFGVLGSTAPYPVLLMLSVNNLRKVNNIEEFRQKNALEQKKIVDYIEKKKKLTHI